MRRDQSLGARTTAAPLLAAALAASMGGCAPAAPPQTAPGSSAAPATTRRFASLSEAAPALLALEDRRAFEAETLEAAARSADSAVRARAALALGRIGDERGSETLRRLAADPAPGARASAAFGAALLGDPTLTDALIPLLADADERTAANAAWAVGFLRRGDGEDALIAAIPRASSPGRRAALLRALWRYTSPAALAAALAYASDPDVRVRSAALYALARRPQEGALPALTAALADSDTDSAALAARALGLLGKKESLPALAAALDDPRTPVVVNSLLALETAFEKNAGGQLAPDRVSRVLALAGDANPNLAVPALEFSRWFAADRDVFRKLWSAATTGQGRRRQVALSSVVAVLREKAGTALDSAMASESPSLRAAAAQALAYLPATEAAPRRARLMTDPQVVVRLGVLRGLETHTTVLENRALVDAALADPDAGVRAAAIEALARLAEPSILPAIASTLAKSQSDPVPDVAIAAIAVAEGQASAPPARAIVEAAYRHPSTLVSRLARRSLVRVFRADAAGFPWRTYQTGKSVADYASILVEAARPRTASVETARGTFVVQLAGAEAPMTVMNLVDLARKGYFDGVPIHRVVPNYVIQDGDPTGTGNGGPGYEIRDEINEIPYLQGTLGMALSGPDTGGSQWFVTQSPQPHLDGIYTAFGRVLSGMDVVLRIEQGDRIVRLVVRDGS